MNFDFCVISGVRYFVLTDTAAEAHARHAVDIDVDMIINT